MNRSRLAMLCALVGAACLAAYWWFGVRVGPAPPARGPVLASQTLIPGFLKADWKASSFSTDGRTLLVVDDSRSFLFDVVSARELRPVELPAPEKPAWSRPVAGTSAWLMLTDQGRLLELDGATGKATLLMPLANLKQADKVAAKSASFEQISPDEIMVSMVIKRDAPAGSPTADTDEHMFALIALKRKAVSWRVPSAVMREMFAGGASLAVNPASRSVAAYAGGDLALWRLDEGNAQTQTCLYETDGAIGAVERIGAGFLVAIDEQRATVIAPPAKGIPCSPAAPVKLSESTCHLNLPIASIAGRGPRPDQLVVVTRQLDVLDVQLSGGCQIRSSSLGNVSAASMAAPIYTSSDPDAKNSWKRSSAYITTPDATTMVANGTLVTLHRDGKAPTQRRLLVGNPSGAYEIEAGRGFLLASRLMAPIRVFDYAHSELRTVQYDYRRYLDQTFFYNKPYALASGSGWIAVLERDGTLRISEATGSVDTAALPPPQLLRGIAPSALCLSDDGRSMSVVSHGRELVRFQLQPDRRYKRTGARVLAATADIYKVACDHTGGIVVAADSLSDNVHVVDWDKPKAQVIAVTGSGSETARPALSPDGLLFAVGPYLYARSSTGTPFTLAQHVEGAARLAFSDDASLVFAAGDKSRLFELVAGQSGIGLKQLPADLPTAHSGAFIDNDYLALVEGTGELQIMSTQAARLGRLTFGEGKQWMFSDDLGRFDTNDIEAEPAGAWVMPDRPLQALDPEMYMRDYLEPRMLSRLIACKRDEAADPAACASTFSPVRPVASLSRERPRLTITKVERENADSVAVTVRLTSQGEGGEPAGGIFDLHLRVDGQLAARRPQTPALAQSLTAAADIATWRGRHQLQAGAGSIDVTIPGIRLPRQRDGGEVTLSAYAFNRDRVKSKTIDTAYRLTVAPAPRRRAFVVAVGVSAYQDSSMDLRYAADDARQIIGSVVPALTRTGRFDEVIPLLVTSDWVERGGQRVVTNASAGKERIRAVLEALSYGSSQLRLSENAAPLRIERASPDDTILLFFAGHGLAAAGEFYFAPYDSGAKQKSDDPTKILDRSKLVSSSELAFWLRDLTGDDIVMILETCHSAASIESAEFKPGPMGSRGLGQLAYDKGMRVLASTRPNDLSWERESKGQGLLTYALVREGLTARKADRLPTDGNIKIGEWLQYAAERVPALYTDTDEGGLTTFGGDDRRPRALTANGKRVVAGGQQPTIFSYRRRPDVTLEDLSLR